MLKIGKGGNASMQIKSRINPIKFLFILMILLSIIFIPTAFATSGGGDVNGEGHRIVDGIDYDNDNNGQGWDIGGMHFGTYGE